VLTDLGQTSRTSAVDLWLIPFIQDNFFITGPEIVEHRIAAITEDFATRSTNILSNPAGPCFIGTVSNYVALIGKLVMFTLFVRAGNI
jgi:hypothetical protein